MHKPTGTYNRVNAQISVMRALILAPHQDDEILGACALMDRLLRFGVEVCVAYLTNGDYRGRKAATVRCGESAAALRLLGVDGTYVFYLGYGDTGMRYEHSFLYQLYHMEDDQLLRSKTAVQTYYPGAGQTLHHLCTNQEAPYTRRYFLQDLNCLLEFCHPDVVVLPSPYDLHGDHRACFLFMSELLRGREHPVLLTYLLHAGSDSLWPNRKGAEFCRPPCLCEAAWNHRIILHLSEAERQKKLCCIDIFQSQLSTAPTGYLSAFAKYEEWFVIVPVSLP